MDIEIQSLQADTRQYPPSVIQSITPKTPIPDEIRVGLEDVILCHERDAFISAILEWKLTTIYCINFRPKDMMTLFERYDSYFLETLREMKTLQDSNKDPKNLEDRLERIIKAGIQLLEILRSVKFVALFKSSDLIIDVFKTTSRFSTLLLAMAMLVQFLVAFRKREIVIDYLKERNFELVTAVYICALQFNALSSEMKYDFEDLLCQGTLPKKMQELILKPEVIIDSARDYNLNFKDLTDYDHPASKNERSFNLQDIIRKPTYQLNNLLNTFAESKLRQPLDQESPLRLALRLKIMMLKELSATKSSLKIGLLGLYSHSVINIITNDKTQTAYLQLNQKIFSPIVSYIHLENLEKWLQSPLPHEYHSAILTTCWSKIQSQAFDSLTVNYLHKILYRILSNIHRLMLKERSENVKEGIPRKASVDEIEVAAHAEHEIVPKTVFACTEENYINTIVAMIKDVFVFEDTSVDNGIQSDFSQVFEVISTYLYFLKDDDKDYFNFSPKFISHIFEMLKLDMGACPTIIKKLLDLLHRIIKKPVLKYKDSEGNIRELSQERLNEYLLELIELVDSLFVEPTKNFYISSISQFAREAAEHPIWQDLINVPKCMKQVYLPIVVFLDDILTEMPENLVNPTLKTISENGLTGILIQNFLETNQLDFEFIGFFVQFLGKNINSPYKSENFEEKLEVCLAKAFSCIYSRSHVIHNIKRFSGADSTNSLVVLAEEIIDLVNVKKSTSEIVIKLIGKTLDEMLEMFQEMWRLMPKIVKSQPINPDDAPRLKSTGWLFTENIKDNFLILEKLSQNFTKFYAKFYDIHRTDLHKEFEKIEAMKKFILIEINHPLFDTMVTKQRRFLSNSFSRMINQSGNEAQKEASIDICFSILEDLAKDFFLHMDQLNDGGTELIGFFLFKQSENVVSTEVFQNEENEKKILNVLQVVNKYHGLMMVSDLLKISMNFNKFEHDEDQKLRSIYPKLVEIETRMIDIKVKYFLKRVTEWPDIIALGKEEITFDNFSDYTFGALEMFTNETASKSFDKIFKNINQSSIEGKVALIQNYVETCSKVLVESNLSDEVSFENAFRYSKYIQAFAYMISNFESPTILMTLKERGVLQFCSKAIIFGLNFVKHYKEDLVRLKSIKEEKKLPDNSKFHQKPKISVKVDKDLNNLKYVMETLCPKLALCWKIIGEYFCPQRPDTLFSKEEEDIHKERFNAARFTTLCVVRDIVMSTPPEVAEIVDKSNINDPFEELPGQKTLKVVLENVSNGHDTLRNILSFLNQSIISPFSLVTKYFTIMNKIENPTNNWLSSEEKKAETVEIKEEVGTGNSQQIGNTHSQQVNEETMVEEETKSLSENQQCDAMPERLNGEKFLGDSKKVIKRILDSALAHKLNIYEQYADTFSTSFISSLVKLEVTPKKNIQKLLTRLTLRLGDLRSSLFYKNEQLKEKSATKYPDKFRISRNLLKDFKIGNFNIFRHLKVVLTLLSQTLIFDEERNLGLATATQFNSILSFITDILENFHKLTEIKQLAMESEPFNRRYSKVLGLLDQLVSLAVLLNKRNSRSAKDDIKEEQAPPTLQRKTSVSKKTQKVKEKAVVDSLKKDLILAVSSYLSYYPHFIKQRVNLVSSGTVGNLCNLIYYFSKEKPELKDIVKSEEIIKKMCRAGVISEDNDGVLDVIGLRGFLALLESQVKTDKLVEESLKLEVNYYFKMHQKVHEEKKIEAEESSDEEGSIHPNKIIKLAKFDEDFKRVYSSNLDILVRVVKAKCEIHSHGEEKYITLKSDVKDKEFNPDLDTTSTVLVLIKEVMRCSTNILIDRMNLPIEKQPVRPLISLTHLIESLRFICSRYPLILKFIISYNISKIVKKVKNAWVRERFDKEFRENSSINFLQFYIRIILFIDPKNFQFFMTDCCKDSYVIGVDRSSKQGSQLTINSLIRRTYHKEVLAELQELREEIMVLNSQKGFSNEIMNELGLPNRYYIQKLAVTYCSSAQELGCMIHHLKYIDNNGEINLYLCQKVLSEILESFDVQSISVHSDIYEVISKSVFMLMKINFLCHANKVAIIEHNPLYQLKHGQQRKPSVVLNLDDFDSFRSKWPEREATKGFKKSMLMLTPDNIEVDKYKEMRDATRDTNGLLFGAPNEEDMLSDFDEMDYDSEMDDEIGEEDQDEINEDEIPFDDILEQHENEESFDDEDGDDQGSEEEGSSTQSIDSEFGDEEMESYEDFMDEESMEEAELFQRMNEELTPEQLISLFDDMEMHEGMMRVPGNSGQPGNGNGQEEGSHSQQGFDADRQFIIEAEENEDPSSSSGESRSSFGARSSEEEANEHGSESTIVRKWENGRKSKGKDTIKDALSEVSKQYPFLVKTDLAGVLTVVFIDYQMLDNFNCFEDLVEQWEVTHSKEKYPFRDNLIYFKKIRDLHRKESLILKNIMPNSASPKGMKSIFNMPRRGFFSFGFSNGAPFARIRNNLTEARLIMGPNGGNPMNFAELINFYTEAQGGEAQDRARQQARLGEIEGLRESSENSHQGAERRHSQAQGAGTNLSAILLEEMPIVQHSEPNKNEEGDYEDEEDNDPLGIYELMEVEGAFEFKEFGLKANFLEKNNIDPLFFSVLEDNMKFEVIRGFLSEEEKAAFNRKVGGNKKQDRKEDLAVYSTPVRHQLNSPRRNPFLQQGENRGSGQELARVDYLEPGEIDVPHEELVSANRSDTVTTSHPRNEDSAGRDPTESYDEVMRGVLDRQQSREIEHGELNNVDQLEEAEVIERSEEGRRQNSPGVVLPNLPVQIVNELELIGEGQEGEIENRMDEEQPDVQVENRINLENVDFINSLTPGLREEILYTSPRDFISSLTDGMQEEARALRENRRGLRPNFELRMDDGMQGGLGFNDPMIEMDDIEDQEEENERESSKSLDRNFNQIDISIFLKINKIRESFIKSIISSLYIALPSNVSNFNLFSVVMANYTNQARLLDALLFILENPKIDRMAKRHNKFPPRTFSVYPNTIVNYHDVYRLVSVKILNILNEVSSDFNTFFLSKANSSCGKSSPVLSEITKIRTQCGKDNVEKNGFWRLIDLLRVDYLVNEKDAIKQILSIIYNILYTSKKKRKEFDSNFILERTHIKLLCETLSNDELQESGLTSLSNIISILCSESNNLTLFIEEMKRTLKNLIDPISQENVKILTMVREAKRQDVLNSPEFVNVLSYHLSNKKKEDRLLKVFKTIEQLFERYFEVLHKNQKDAAVKDNLALPDGEEKKEKEKNDEESEVDLVVSEATNKEIREKFGHLLEDQKIFQFWLELINIIKYINDEDVEFIKLVHPHSENLQVLLECFFISFKILKDDDHISILRMKSTGKRSKLRKKSIQIANFVDELEAEELENPDMPDFEDLSKKNLSITELFTLMCESNNTFINYIIEKEIKLLNGSFSCILKVT